MLGTNVRGKDLRDFLEELADTATGQLDIVDKTSGKLTTDLIRQEVEASKPEVVYVDYAQITRSNHVSEFAPDWEQQGVVSKEIQAMAGEFGIPFVVASQLKRSDDAKGSRIPESDAFSRSDAWGQDADFAVNFTDPAPNALIAKIVKGRSQRPALLRGPGDGQGPSRGGRFRRARDPQGAVPHRQRDRRGEVMSSILDEARIHAWATLRTDPEIRERFDQLVRTYLSERETTYNVLGLLKPQMIIEAVALEAGVEARDVLGRHRPHLLLVPRSVAMLLIYEYVPGMSYPKLGQIFDGRDHSSARHACERARAELQKPGSDTAKLWNRVTVELTAAVLKAA
jgi:hypothetical protein